MRALITGISGFVGSHLAEYLLEHTDWHVAGTVYGPEENIEHLRDRLELYPAELSELETVTSILEQAKPDYIFHLAAQPLVSLSRRDPWGTLAINIRLQLNILEAVARLGSTARILVVGSSEEYGLVRPDELPIKETNPLRPTSPYAVSKVAQDMLGLQYHLSHQLFTVRVRSFNHIGPRQRLGFVAPDFARQIAQAEAGLQEPVIQVGNLEPQRDFSDVRDVVRGYHLLITEGEAGEVYNLGSEQARSVRELLEKLIAMSKIPIIVEQDPERLRPTNVPVIVADCTRIREQTGWRTTIPFEDSLQDVLDYWRERIREDLEIRD
ncbi:MAG: GDP-mannose 4,6-dehydratase [Anaerolineae bacterium]|nr:GDP-mannose 4,6-dehydratase [Anaerolineae bacterium]